MAARENGIYRDSRSKKNRSILERTYIESEKIKKWVRGQEKNLNLSISQQLWNRIKCLIYKINTMAILLSDQQGDKNEKLIQKTDFGLK